MVSKICSVILVKRSSSVRSKSVCLHLAHDNLLASLLS